MLSPDARASAMRSTPPDARPAETRAPTQSASPHRPSPPEQHLAAADKPSGDWMVQLGVFAKQANADRLAQDLKGKGFHALVSEVTVHGKTFWRVRAGPVAQRAAAEQLNARLRVAGHAGSVVQK